jgi:ADP-heptose:LPS heptosyltransferase
MRFELHDKTISEKINAKPWHARERPKRILAIRLQALGDVVIALPYLQSLKNNLPAAQIDFLTRKEVDDIPRNLDLFGRVFSIGGGRNFKKQAFSALLLLPQLWARRYEVVIDLQRNPLSRWIRKRLYPKWWSEFDRFSPKSAGERNRLTIAALELGSVSISQKLKLKNQSLGLDILKAAGWNPACDLVALNPAGGFPTKNWPLQNYVEFAKLWLAKYHAQTQFLILGVDAIFPQAQFLQAQFGSRLINLVNRTSPSEALAILQKADLLISEDSGLMHMAWILGIPVVALFGSSRSDWSAPLGNYSLCLNSADLPCGECLARVCQFGDIHCLTRHTPEKVFALARALFEKSKNAEVFH